MGISNPVLYTNHCRGNGVLSRKSFRKLILNGAGPIDIQEVFVVIALSVNVVAPNQVNTMAADVLVTHVTRTSAAMTLTMQVK